MTSDANGREAFKNHDGVTKLVNILGSSGERDWTLSALVCQTLWNVCSSSGAFPGDPMAVLDALVKLTGGYKQEQELFPIRIYRRAKIRVFTLQSINLLNDFNPGLSPLCSVYHGLLYTQISVNVLSYNFYDPFHESISRSRPLPVFPSDYCRYPQIRITCVPYPLLASSLWSFVSNVSNFSDFHTFFGFQTWICDEKCFWLVKRLFCLHCKLVLEINIFFKLER